MAKTSRGIEIPDAELNARKWGQSGKGLARINDQGSIEVYDEQWGAPTALTPAASPAPAATPTPTPATPEMPAAPAAPAVPQTYGDGAGFKFASPTAALQTRAQKPGAAPSAMGGYSPLLAGRLY
jgi:hypothetical protein